MSASISASTASDANDHTTTAAQSLPQFLSPPTPSFLPSPVSATEPSFRPSTATTTTTEQPTTRLSISNASTIDFEAPAPPRFSRTNTAGTADTDTMSVGAYLFGRDIQDRDLFDVPRLTTNITLNPSATTKPSGLVLLEHGRHVDDDHEHTDNVVEKDGIVNTNDVGMDSERLVQLLCDFPDGFGLLLREAKKNILSTKEMATFLKKRAEAEDQYAKNMIKAAQLAYKSEGKSGSFGNTWQQLGKIHERLGAVHAKLADALNSLAEDMNLMQKDTERSRKSLKDGHARRLKDVNDADTALEKSRSKYESLSEEWEKSIMAEQQQQALHASSQSFNNNFVNSSTSIGGHGSGSGGTNAGHGSGASPTSRRKFTVGKSMNNTISFFKTGIEKNFKRTEEDIRIKAAAANDAYKAQLQSTNTIRNDFYRLFLPQFVKHLKQTLDDADDRLCQFMRKYTDIVSRARVEEDVILNPASNPKDGFVKLVDGIDVRRDLQHAAQELTKTRPIDKNDREYVAYKGSGVVASAVSGSPLVGGIPGGPGSSVSNAMTGSSLGSSSQSNNCNNAVFDHLNLPQQRSFGVRLSQLLDSEYADNPVPPVVVRLIEYIESHGMQTQGLYRVSGSNTLLQKLKQAFDRDPVHANIDSLEIDDIHVVAGVLKLFFRELPDPLIPHQLYRQFIDASKIDDDRMRLIQIHELVNTLDDAHYATLKHLAAHLWRVQSLDSVNKMSVANLSIVWGPTLMDPPVVSPDANELRLQSKVVETILTHYEHIFDTE